MATKNEKPPVEENALTKTQLNQSERFTNMVMKEYAQDGGKVNLDGYQRRLAQHMFLKIDFQLRALDTDRAKKNPNNLPITWENANLAKLAIDSMHRIELGLDALIPNHIHPIPYLNGKTGKYDVDLRVGYAGKDYYYRKMALNPPVDIIYELVHENDRFAVIKKSIDNAVESYEFEIPKPFDRGKVVGGFGYIMYENSELNKLVILTVADFNRAKSKSGTTKFWGPYEADMQLKTVVHQTVKKIVLDPKKINASFSQVEADEYAAMDAGHNEIDYKSEIEKEANQGELIDMGIQKNAAESENGAISENDEQVDQNEDDSGKDTGQGKPKPSF